MMTGSLPAEGAARLARELELLERGLPVPGDTLLNDAADEGLRVWEGDGSFFELPLVSRFENWRFLGSTRLIISEGLERRVALLKRAVRAYRVSASEALKVYGEVMEELARTRNPATEPGNSLHYEGLWFRYLAQLRLLRVAAHFQATGGLLVLDDPFGTKLLTSVSGASLKAWSVAGNGIDDGGIGGWFDLSSKDIVLEVPR